MKKGSQHKRAPDKLLFAIVTLSINLPGPALAQAFETDMRPGVRYTTGSYKIEGWQNELLKGDKNLAHWNWSPIVGYTQSTPSRRTGRQSSSAPVNNAQQSCYVKPIHVPTLVAALPHRALARKMEPPSGASSEPNTSARISASLSRNTTNTSALLRKRPVKVYSYRSLPSSTAYGALERREVYGLIRSAP